MFGLEERKEKRQRRETDTVSNENNGNGRNLSFLETEGKEPTVRKGEEMRMRGRILPSKDQERGSQGHR